MRRHAPQRYYHTRVKRGVTGLYDTWLILGGHQWEEDRLFEREVVSLQITGTNGQLSLSGVSRTPRQPDLRWAFNTLTELESSFGKTAKRKGTASFS